MLINSESFHQAWENKFVKPCPLDRVVHRLEELGISCTYGQAQRIFEWWGHGWPDKLPDFYDKWEEIEERMKGMSDYELMDVVEEFIRRGSRPGLSSQ